MKKHKRSKRIKLHEQRAVETEADEVPSLLRDRFEAQRKRARKADAFNAKLVRASLKQLGLTREVLEKRADADFARAKADPRPALRNSADCMPRNEKSAEHFATG